MFITSFLSKFDPRASLASSWEKSSFEFEENLNNSSHISSEIKEGLILEKERIKELFINELPSKKDKIFVVITNDAIVQSCSIFVWKEKIYVLVSAALLGAPMDFPTTSIKEGWKWLALHEISHLNRFHLPTLFHIRRLFRFFLKLSPPFFILSFFSGLSYLYPLYLFVGAWAMQLVTALACEFQADIDANNKTTNAESLKEAAQLLKTMTFQAINRLPKPYGSINYIIHCLFVDPHPPLKIRLWLMSRRLSFLEKQKKALS